MTVPPALAPDDWAATVMTRYRLGYAGVRLVAALAQMAVDGGPGVPLAPGIEKLAARLDVTAPRVRFLLRQFTEDGYLIRAERGGRGSVTRRGAWQLALPSAGSAAQ